MRAWRLSVLAIAAAVIGGCRHAPPAAVPENPVVVAEVRFEGFDALPADARDDLEGDLRLAPGDALTDEAEKAAGDRAVEILQNHGYPYAQVSLARLPIDPGRSRVVVRADPGTLGYFGPIDIVGNRTIDDAIIRRRLAYAPGDLFRRSAIERTQQRIGALGLFKSVEIRALVGAAASGANGAPRSEGAGRGVGATGSIIDMRPAEVPTLITVEERSPWRWNLSLGYAAGERLGLEGRISHLNFLGAARRLDLQGRVSRIERSGEVGFTQTEAWHPSLSLSLQARHQEIDERSFFVMSRGGQAAVSWQWTPELATTASYAATLERSDVAASLDPLLGLQDGMLSAWSLDFEHRRVARGERVGQLGPIDGWPSRIMSLHLEQAGGWLPGTFNYFNVIGDVRHYRRAFGDRVVFASRLRYASIDPAADEADIPLLKRFFLGGSNEMRGWGIYELSPLSASGEPVGGKAMATATGEIRFRILSRLSGAFFVEAGNVWQDAWAVHLNDVLYDAGPGVRFDTPFGLLRFDFGYQLKTLEGLRIDGQPQDNRWRINFGIGEAF
jgi:outer membrane protein assembly factor BamA